MNLDYTLSLTRLKAEQLDVAIEYGGRALLIQINTLGVMHQRTAESHFYMGVLYRTSLDYHKARRELSISSYS